MTGIAAEAIIPSVVYPLMAGSGVCSASSTVTVTLSLIEFPALS